MSISEDTKELNSYINERVDIDSVATFKELILTLLPLLKGMSI